MEIEGNDGGCPKGPTTNHQNTKQTQPKSPKPPKTSKSDGNRRKWYGVPQWGLTKNHQNRVEIKGNGKGYLRGTVVDVMETAGKWYGVGAPEALP